MTLTEILLILRKRFWLVIAGALIAGTVAVVLSLVWPPKYQSEALLLITKLRSSVTLDPRFQTVSEENVVQLSLQDEQVRRQTLVALAQSQALLLEVIDLLGDTLSPDERSVAYLRGAMDAGTQGNLITLQAEASSSTKAASIANAWAQAYQAQVNRLYSTTSPSTDQIQGQLEKALADYDDAKSAVVRFILSSPLNELERQVAQKEQRLADLQAAYLSAARIKVSAYLDHIMALDLLLLKAKSLKNQLADSPAVAPLTDGETLALFMLEANAFAQDELSSVTLDLGAGWPGQDRVTRGDAADRLDRLIDTVDTARAAGQSEVDSLSGALLESEDLLTLGLAGEGAESIAKLQTEINRLQSEIQNQELLEADLVDARTVTQESYLTLVRKAAEVQILSDLTGIEVQIAAAAQPPAQPSFPRPLLATVLGVMAGGLAGLVLAFVLEFWPPVQKAVSA